MVEIKIKAGVIHYGNKKVGKIGLSELDTPNPQFIDYIEIYPQYRGRGFARATIELLKSQYSEIIIGDPHENNPGVKRIREFWRKMGFNTIGEFIGWKKERGLR